MAAWENLTFTPDPIASSLEKSKDDAVEAGLLDDVDLDGIYDLDILNELLQERGEQEVAGLTNDRTASSTGVGQRAGHPGRASRRGRFRRWR